MSGNVSSWRPSSKRSHHSNTKESNGRKYQKLQNSSSHQQVLKSSFGNAELRLLCPNSKAEVLTGPDGSFVSQVCQETGVSIRLDEPVSGCDERVIVITEPAEDSKSGKDQRKDDEEMSTEAELTNDSQNQEDNDGDKKSPQSESSDCRQGLLAIQSALLLLFDKISAEEQHMKNDNDGSNEPSSSFLRLLVLSTQVGCILGKGGSTIKQMANESGSQIQVLPRDELPTCAASFDEVVQISGARDAVKTGIKLVSEQILQNIPKDPDRSGPPRHHTSRSEAHKSLKFSSQAAPFRVGSRDFPDHPNMAFKFHETFLPNQTNVPPEMLTFRILCPTDRVGGLIGKGGNVVKGIQHETGCKIEVIEDDSFEEDRIIAIAGPTHPDERISPVQDAVLLVQARVSKTESDNKEKVVAKLLVPSSQIGCLLGKGGAVIAEMRKITGAYIRILGKDQIPKCASENEEVVQINGTVEMVQKALLQVTYKLRHHFFREVYPSLKLPLDSPMLDSSIMRRRELSPPGGFHNLGHLPHFDSAGGPPLRPGFHPHDDHRPPFTHDIHRPGIPHIPDRPWGPQVLMEGGPMGSVDFVGGPHMRMAGYGGRGSHQAIITNTKVEVVVPSFVVPSIYGEGGGCLKQIRQISEAKIIIDDPKPGAAETIVVISGTPEQTHAAQSLIQAFVISETESS